MKEIIQAIDTASDKPKQDFLMFDYLYLREIMQWPFIQSQQRWKHLTKRNRFPTRGLLRSLIITLNPIWQKPIIAMEICRKHMNWLNI